MYVASAFSTHRDINALTGGMKSPCAIVPLAALRHLQHVIPRSTDDIILYEGGKYCAQKR